MGPLLGYDRFCWVFFCVNCHSSSDACFYHFFDLLSLCFPSRINTTLAGLFLLSRDGLILFLFPYWDICINLLLRSTIVPEISSFQWCPPPSLFVGAENLLLQNIMIRNSTLVPSWRQKIPRGSFCFSFTMGVFCFNALVNLS